MRKNERMGLIIIAAALSAIAMIIILLFEYQYNQRVADNRAQGVSLARLLSGMKLEQLTPGDRNQGLLAVLKQTLRDSDFAYVALVDIDGGIKHAITSDGVIIPQAVMSREPSAWFGEAEHRISAGSIHEFFAPVLDQGRLAAYVRVAYFQPGYGLSLDQIPFFASIALPVFLLAPLFYFLLRREVRPLHKLNSEIQNIVESGKYQRVEINATGELADFMHRLNHFIEQAQTRIQDLEQSQSGLLTSTKLISYQRARIETVLQAIPDGVIVLDESGVISFANAKVGNLLGIPSSEMHGQTARDWCDDGELLAFINRAGAIRQSGYKVETFDFCPKKAPEKNIRASAYPLFSPKDSSAVFGSLIVFRDVTLENLAKQSRGEFVAHVAHELKTPLNVLAMYSEALLGEDGKSEEFRIEGLNVISDEVERLSTLINNMLSITKIEMGSLDLDKQRVRLSELLQDTFDQAARGAHSKDITFEANIPKEMSPISVDKDLLRVAINNLLSNAIKYNVDKGKVILDAQESDEALVIKVKDSGIGISSGDKERIFDKFYRSSSQQVRERAGHGLGLALTRDIVHLHNGTIQVNSTEGEGTEFIIELQKSTGIIKQAI